MTKHKYKVGDRVMIEGVIKRDLEDAPVYPYEVHVDGVGQFKAFSHTIHPAPEFMPGQEVEVKDTDHLYWSTYRFVGKTSYGKYITEFPLDGGTTVASWDECRLVKKPEQQDNILIVEDKRYKLVKE